MPTVHANGIDIYYEVQGEGEPIVLVHGLGVSGRYFESLGNELARSFRVSIPDLPGWRTSERPRRALTLDELAEVLAELAGQQDGAPVFVANSVCL